MRAFEFERKARYSRNMKVLVLGHDTGAFLAVIRSLGRGGVEVHVAWHDRQGPASRSRYILTGCEFCK